MSKKPKLGRTGQPRTRRKPPTTCNGCGACCDPITYDRSPTEIKQAAASGDEEAQWMLDNTTPLSVREGTALHRDYSDGTTLLSPDGKGGFTLVGAAFFYACRHFDADTRQCGNYENRPSMCRQWPWYGSPPNPMKFLPTPCSFRADLNKSITPIEVVLTARRERQSHPT